MKVLCIDTSCDALTLCLGVDGKVYPYKSDSARQSHSVLLLPAIDELLRQANIKLSDIDYFSAVVGPGSFTGVRIGVATVNAFGYVYGKKVIGVTSFEPFSYNTKRFTDFAIDAKHSNYYLATKVGDSLEYKTIEGEPLKKGAKLLQVEKVKPKDLLGATLKKIENGDGVVMLEPFYMRASEAERNKQK